MLVTKTGEREAFIRAEIGKENEILMQKINDLNEIIKQKDEHISLITENPNLKIKPKKIELKLDKNQKNNPQGKAIIEGEFSFDDAKKDSNRFNAGFEGPTGKFDSQGNYRYDNGTYYDADGFFHDEKGNVYDPEGNFVDKNVKPKVEDIKSDIIAKIKKEDKKDIVVDKNNEFSDFDVDEEDDDEVAPKDIKIKLDEVENKPVAVEVKTEVNPKGKHGRPRKPKTEEQKIPKKRGRPRKEKKEEDLKPKRKRGRPRKIVSTMAPQQPKRGRGRPKKEKVEESKVVKKGRGRPRKIQEEPEKVKKGRGRPKKIDLNDLKEIEKKIKEQNNILKGQKTDLKKTLKKATKK